MLFRETSGFLVLTCAIIAQKENISGLRALEAFFFNLFLGAKDISDFNKEVIL